MKYLVIPASKGSYDRPIEIEPIKLFDTYDKAFESLKGWIWVEDIRLMLNEIIIQKESSIWDECDDIHYFEYDKKNRLVYYSNGCRASNEYDGHSVQIVEVTDE